MLFIYLFREYNIVLRIRERNIGDNKYIFIVCFLFIVRRKRMELVCGWLFFGWVLYYFLFYFMGRVLYFYYYFFVYFYSVMLVG